MSDLELPRSHRLRVAPPRRATALYHRRLIHRVVPDRLGTILARLAARAEWHVSARRREVVLERAALLLGDDAPAAVRSRFARRSMGERSVRREIEWRPWTARAAAIDGIEYLEALRRQRRGIILASLHLGPFMSLPLAVAERGIRCYVAGGAPTDLVHDPQIVGLNRDLERAGGRWVLRGGSFPLFEALLRRGELCHLMLDTPRAEVEARLAGQPVRLAGGVARLALNTSAPVLPGCAIHYRGLPRLVLLEPVEAEPGDDEQSLVTRVAERLDPLVRAHLTQWRPPLSVIDESRQPG